MAARRSCQGGGGWGLLLRISTDADSRGDKDAQSSLLMWAGSGGGGVTYMDGGSN